MPTNSRLLKIAGMIRKGDAVADIGTDHAYLPVFLIKSGISKKVFACDVSDGPLKNAEANILKSGVKGIVLRKGDGLNAVSPDEIDTAVIAGMGGDLIIKILSCAEWIKNSRYQLIVQPMTSVEDLRRYLCDNGFAILEERAVSSANRIYTVIKAEYIGEPFSCDGMFYYFGKLMDSPQKDEFTYIKRKYRIIKKIAVDIEKVDEKKNQFEMLSEVLKKTEEFFEKWQLTDYFYTGSKKK